MNIKLILQPLVFALLFTSFRTHQTWGEQDCYEEKRWVILYCGGTISNVGPYEPPTNSCLLVCRKADMPCICRVLNYKDECLISAVKLVQLAKACGYPLPVGSKCGSKYLILCQRCFATHYLALINLSNANFVSQVGPYHHNCHSHLPRTYLQ